MPAQSSFVALLMDLLRIIIDQLARTEARLAEDPEATPDGVRSSFSALLLDLLRIILDHLARMEATAVADPEPGTKPSPAVPVADAAAADADDYVQPPDDPAPTVLSLKPGNYYVVYKPAPHGLAGLYKTKHAFAKAVEYLPGCFEGRRGEVIVVHPEAEVLDTGVPTIAEATAKYLAKIGSTPQRNW